MSDICETLEKARDLITDKNNWAQARFHRVKTGFFGKGHDQYCLLGAIGQAKNGNPYTFDIVDEVSLLRDFTRIDPMRFNDTHTHQEVLKVLDKAIRYCKDGGDGTPTVR